MIQKDPTERPEMKQVVSTISRTFNPDEKGENDLYRAARAGDVGRVMSLLEQGALFKSITNDGCTPLLVAANNGHDKVVDEFIQFYERNKNQLSIVDFLRPFKTGATPFFPSSTKWS